MQLLGVVAALGLGSVAGDATSASPTAVFYLYGRTSVKTQALECVNGFHARSLLKRSAEGFTAALTDGQRLRIAADPQVFALKAGRAPYAIVLQQAAVPEDHSAEQLARRLHIKIEATFDGSIRGFAAHLSVGQLAAVEREASVRWVYPSSWTWIAFFREVGSPEETARKIHELERRYGFKSSQRLLALGGFAAALMPVQLAGIVDEPDIGLVGPNSTYLGARASIHAQPRIVVYGQRTKLAGNAGDIEVRPSELTLLQQTFEADRATQLGTVEVAGDGSWQATVRPSICTVYEPDFGDRPPAVVEVRPRVVLRRIHGRRFEVSAHAARSFAGRSVVLQRFVGGRWRSGKRVLLDASSSASFRVAGDAAMRILMPLREAQPGYVVGFSRAVHVGR